MGRPGPELQHIVGSTWLWVLLDLQFPMVRTMPRRSIFSSYRCRSMSTQVMSRVSNLQPSAVRSRPAKTGREKVWMWFNSTAKLSGSSKLISLNLGQCSTIIRTKRPAAVLTDKCPYNLSFIVSTVGTNDSTEWLWVNEGEIIVSTFKNC